MEHRDPHIRRLHHRSTAFGVHTHTRRCEVEPCGEGEKVRLQIQSDSWFVAFCIAHARHILAVAPETLRTMIIARAKRELSMLDENGEADSAEEHHAR